MQTLYYRSASGSLELIPQTEGALSSYWSGVTSLITSASLLQIIAFSGSTELAAFPINNTTIIYNTLPVNTTTPQPYPTIAGQLFWVVKSNYYGFVDTEYSLIESASAQTLITGSVAQLNSGFVTLDSGSYILYYLRGTSSLAPLDYSSSIIIKNTTAGTAISASNYNSPVAGGFDITFGSFTGSYANYEVTMSLEFFGILT